MKRPLQNVIFYGKHKLFYVDQVPGEKAFNVCHRQLSGPDRVCSVFYYDWSVSKTRALKASKVFCKQMNDYYPGQPKF